MRICLKWGRVFGEQGWREHQFWHRSEKSPRLRHNREVGAWMAPGFQFAVLERGNPG